MHDSRSIVADLKKAANPAYAEVARRFFKTGPGEYGEGDEFLGIRMPDLRRFARTFADTPFAEVTTLLASPFHEARMLALLLLARRYERAGGDGERSQVFRAYLANTRHINNWDLVDVTAPGIVGVHLFTRDRKPLYRLAGSANLWEQRIAIVATFLFIRRMQFADTLRIAALYIDHPHDLIHKATGWMLREVGKRDRATLEGFLDKHAGHLPRTMLRYAIERLPEPRRRHYLHHPR